MIQTETRKYDGAVAVEGLGCVQFASRKNISPRDGRLERNGMNGMETDSWDSCGGSERGRGLGLGGHVRSAPSS